MVVLKFKKDGHMHYSVGDKGFPIVKSTYWQPNRIAISCRDSTKNSEMIQKYVYNMTKNGQSASKLHRGVHIDGYEASKLERKRSHVNMYKVDASLHMITKNSFQNYFLIN